MADERENRTAGPGARVTVIVDVVLDGVGVIEAGQALRVLWFIGIGPYGVATVRRESDGKVIHGLPIRYLIWA